MSVYSDDNFIPIQEIIDDVREIPRIQRTESTTPEPEEPSLHIVRRGERGHNNIIEYLIGNPRVTLFMNVHNRYTDIEIYKKKYLLKNNACTLEGIEPFSLVDKLWISNVENIKRFKIFLVPNDFDTSMLNIDTNIKTHENLFNLVHGHKRQLNRYVFRYK